ncbi:MAG: IclR family transcriptional regulator [Deltaproteobacteria bacterium]|nr:IclR family transcriptional regulator [Deltaproteobacteria bacterium]
MSGTQIKVLDKAIQILELLAAARKGVRLKDVVGSLGLNKSTALRILRVLESHDVVSRNGNATFVLGNRVLWWETCYRRNFDLLEVVRPYLEKVRDLTEETVIFSILVGSRSVIVNQAISPHVTSSRYGLGAAAPLHAGASGKAILAFLSTEKRRQFLRQSDLERLTGRTVTDKKGLERQLAEIRAGGVAITRGERFLNTASVAAPVFNSRGEGVGAIAVIGPSERLTSVRLREIAVLLVKEARLLTEQLSKTGEIV